MPVTKKTIKKTETKEAKATKITPAVPGGKYFYANGKRKCSIARVRLYKGKGVITVNDKAVNKYFDVKTNVGIVKSPLKLTGTADKFDVTVKVTGGGITSQAEAIRHGIARGIVESDPLSKPTLRKAGFLTRDSRVKERKKFGLKRARKAPQFSKR